MQTRPRPDHAWSPQPPRPRPVSAIHEDVRARGLDSLAHWVAERLERGDLEAAWSVTRALEVLDATTQVEEPRPPGPVIGRRFAAAHAARITQPSTATRVAAVA
jgi:hypothetical protein